MLVILAISTSHSLAFVSLGNKRVIDTNYGNANWCSPTTLKLRQLLFKIVLNTVNLLDHRFLKYLCFYTYLDCRHLSTRNDKAWVGYRGSKGNYISERPITPPCRYSLSQICCTQNSTAFFGPIG